MVASPQRARSEERRREPRHQIDAPAFLLFRCYHGSTFLALVKDLGIQGMQLEFPPSANLHEMGDKETCSVETTQVGGDFLFKEKWGRVTWMKDRCMGICTATPLAESDEELLVQLRQMGFQSLLDPGNA